jgi:hypothetical protein
MNVFGPVLFSIAVLASLACTVLLFRGYARSGIRLLFWSALCFVCLTVNNVLLFVDLVVFATEMDLRPHRLLATLVGLLFLLYGFIWEAE